MSESGWKATEQAQHYAKVADVLIPERQKILSLIARLTATAKGDRLRVLDLGCGLGDVTAAILQQKPDAEVCMVDFSDEMIRVSRERFGSNPCISFYQHDLNGGLPKAVTQEQFDVVVSCAALHHVEFCHRVTLYSQICQLLPETGLFVNGDRFCEEEQSVSEFVFDSYIEWALVQLKEHLNKETTFEEWKQGQLESDQEKGDKPGTIWDMQADLKKAGFRSVDCLLKSSIIALIVAVK